MEIWGLLVRTIQFGHYWGSHQELISRPRKRCWSNACNSFWDVVDVTILQRPLEDPGGPFCRPSTVQNMQTSRYIAQCCADCHSRWLLYSPYLNAPDIYLWQHRVYDNNPETVRDLKITTTAAIREIPRKKRWRIIGNFARLSQMFLQNRGSYSVAYFWAPVKQRIFL